MTGEKLMEVCYQPDHLLDAYNDVHTKKGCQVMVSKMSTSVKLYTTQEINQPHYDVTKPNKQHQFHVLYVPHIVFEGNRYK